MVLNAEGGQILMSHAGDSVIVQVAVCDFEVGWESRFLNGETMVLGSDFHFSCFFIEDRLVGTAMTKLQLESLGSTGERQELMSQANAEDRFLAQQIANRANGVSQRLWIARAVG
jgi:hypothetical protein